MFKATTAIASLLFVACVCAFFHLASAPLATTGVVSALLLTLVVTISGMGWRRDAQQKRLFLRSGMVGYLGFRGSFQLFQVLCLLLLWPAQSWAAFTILFNGVVSIVDTGSIVLSNPADVVVDTAGNVYLSDTSNSRIVKLAPDGTASVLAITGLAPALSSPAGLAVDVSGNLYIADAGNARVVKVDSLGNGTPVSTPSITLSSPQGVAVDASSNIFVSDTGNNRIVEVTAGGTASVLSITGLGTAFNTPLGLALDPAGDLFIADSVNSRIVEVAAGGTVGSVLNVSGVSLTTPAGLAADTLGNLYVADTTSTQIIIVNIAYGSASLINTGAVTLNQPQGVAVSASGLLYVADTADNRAISVATSSVAYGHSQLGTSTGKVLTLPFTVGIIATVGNVKVFTDGVENLDFTLQGTNTCTAGTTGDVPCSVDVQFLPTAPGLRRGAIVIYDNSNPEVPLITVPLYGSGDAPLAALSPGTAGVVSTGATALSAPFQVAFDGVGNMYVANYGSAAGNVVKVPAGGGTATVVSTPGFTLAGAIGVALDGAGNLYISDHYNSRILEVTAGGVVSALNIYGVSPALGITGAIAIDEAGNLYISDYGVGRIVKVTPSGAGSVLGTGSFTFASDEVLGVAVDAAGTVYIPDPAGNGVVKVTAAGAASLVVAPGITPPLSSPRGVAVDAFGNLYIADAGNERIVEITTAGVASVVQMPGQSLVTDYGVTVDASGNVFIPDFGANHIVEVSVAGASLSFPNTNVGSTSTALTATVTNIGDLPLLFSTAPTYTANFSEDTGDGNLCAISTSLDPGLACDAAVEFTPQSGGNLSAGIVVTNNNLNVAGATETVAVSGTGIVVADTTAVAVSTSPTSANLGQPITITALVTDTATGHTATIPTGGVTFMDTVGSTSISLNGGAAVTLNGAGAAILTGVTLSGVGTHTITASYAGVIGTFVPSSNTTSIVISALASAVTLNVAPGSSVVAGTAATLTATVTANGAPVTTGTVLFCNATAAQCLGEAVYGSAQLTLAGTAAIKLTLGAGVYSITAAFQATSSTLAGVSAPQPLTVTGAASYLSSTTIAETGVAGNYTLTGTVTAFGAVVPTGTVSFLDTTAGNGVVGTAALNPASLGFTFLPAAGSPVGAGQAPQDTVLGDFNHDGKLDLVVLNNGDQTISVLLGNGDGTFQPQVTYAVGHQSQGIAMGDFNGDGNLDLVVSNYIDDTVSVLLGNGNGTFAPQVTYATAHRPQGIAVADFNGDGHLDLAVVATFGADVSILLGQGDGTFVADSPATFAVGGDPVAIATADFNGDGNADLVVTNSGDGSVSVLLGHGDGTFQSQIVLTIPDEPDLTPIAVGDFNGDGIPDFAVGDAEYDDIYVFLGINGLTFQPPVAYTVGVAPFGIVAADFQGTGHLDLAVTNLGDSTVSLLLNQGDGSGTFQTQVTFPAGSTPLGIAAGDLNGDGLPDLAVANNTYSAPFTASILLAAQTETAVATGQAVYGTGTHNVLASYPGDADRAPSQSTTVPLAAIPQTTTATTFTAAPNPAFAGQPVTLTATVAPAPTGTPLGTVSFYNGSALLGTATVNSSGVATFVGSLPVGVLSVTAVYSGNAGFAGSTSTAQTVTVNLNPTATALAAAPNPASVGQSVTLTATVNPPPLFDLGRRGHAVPGPISLGTVSFYYGPTLLGSGDVNSSGVATSSTTTLPVGADGLTAVYSGDSNFAGSTSIAYTETITEAATSTTTVLTALPNPAIAGQSVTLTATVNPPPILDLGLRGHAVPGPISLGTVSFYYGPTLLGSGDVNSSGVATSSTTTLPVGADGLTAVYSGDSNFAGSTSIAYTETITGAATSTTTVLTALPNPAIAGQSVTLAATVAPAPTGTPTGTVSFYDGTTLLGTMAVNSSGIADFIDTSLPVGALSITAVYSGNAGFSGSTSTVVTETVSPATTATATTTTLTASPNPLFDGQTVTFTATVTPAPTGTSAGIVSFYSGTTLLGTGTLNAAGVATLTLSSLAVGVDSITAVYPGNAGFAPSTSSTLSQTVNTAYTVSGPTTPVPVAPGGSVNINLTVPPLGGAFNSVVTLSASGLPPGATATFNPPTVTPGTAGAPTVMTIQLAAVTASIPAGDIPANPRGVPVTLFSMAFLLFGGVLGRKRMPRGLVLVLALASLGVGTSLLTGCGGGFANTPSTQARTYTVTVTGTSGSFQASTTVTLVVE